MAAFQTVQIALKCADLGHLALPPALHKKWVERLQQEFYAQGDREREAGLPVSALMERSKASKLSSSQVWHAALSAASPSRLFWYMIDSKASASI